MQPRRSWYCTLSSGALASNAPTIGWVRRSARACTCARTGTRRCLAHGCAPRVHFKLCAMHPHCAPVSHAAQAPRSTLGGAAADHMAGEHTAVKSLLAALDTLAAGAPEFDITLRARWTCIARRCGVRLHACNACNAGVPGVTQQQACGARCIQALHTCVHAAPRQAASHLLLLVHAGAQTLPHSTPPYTQHTHTHTRTRTRTRTQPGQHACSHEGGGGGPAAPAGGHAGRRQPAQPGHPV
jgi:hypothetical protein